MISMVAEPYMDNALTRLLWAAIKERYGSPENMARLAKLAPGTVRNILKSGNAARTSLAKLAPLLNRTPDEMYEVAWSDKATTGPPEEAREAAQIVTDAPDFLRPALVGALRVILLELLPPDRLERAGSYLRRANRRRGKS